MSSLLTDAEINKARTDLKVFSDICFNEPYKNEDFHNKWYDIIQDRSVRSGCIIAPRNSAKSTCWAKKGALWLLGDNPDLRIVLVSRTSTLAQMNLAFIRLHIESNDRVREVFPFRKINGKIYGIEQSVPWGTEGITVKNNRMDGAPSVYAVGLGGSITGIRADIILVDDLVDLNNVMTESQREKVNMFWDQTILPSLNPDGRIFAVGTRYHSKDFYARLLADEMFKNNTSMFPAIKLKEDGSGDYLLDENGNMQSYWPERWPINKLLDMKERMGTLAFNSQYQCDPSGYAGQLFDVDDLHFYDPLKDLIPIWGDLEFIMSVDPNVTEDPESDNTAIITAAVDRKRGDIYVLDIYAEPLGFTNQVKMLMKYGKRLQISVGTHRFNSEIKISKIGVEAVAYQRSLHQTGYLAGLPVVEVKQGNRNKEIRILGIQPHIENGRIRFPMFSENSDKKVDWWDAFYEEYYTFPKGRRDDMMDALEILVSMASESFGVSGIPWGPSGDGLQVRRGGRFMEEVLGRMIR